MYEKQAWEDRSVEKPLTYLQSTNEDGSITLTPHEGEVYKQGSKTNASRMNHIEEGIEGAHNLVTDLGKTYTGTNITAPTVAGYGRIKKLYGNTVEEGTGDKSPDNPYELKCVGDDVNLFDETQLDYSIAVGTDKYINLTLEPSTEYTLSTTLPLASTNVAEAFLISGHSISATTNDNGAWNGRPRTITSDSNGYLTIAYRKLNQSTWNLKDYVFKLQKGSVATAYTPYGCGNIEVISTDGTNTSSNVVVAKPLCSLGDVRDELDYTNKKITRRCGLIVLNGTESWLKHANTDNNIHTYYLTLKDLAFDTETTVPKARISHFIYSYSCWNTNKQVGQFSGHTTTNTLYFNSDKTLLEDFKAWLALNPLTIVYKLATPTIEDIECSDKIVQYNGTTNVFNTDGAEIEVSLTNNETISELNENLKNVEEVKKTLKTIWEGELYSVGDSIILQEPLQKNNLYIFTFYGLSGVYLMQAPFTYRNGSYQFSYYDGSNYFRMRLDITNDGKKISVNSDSINNQYNTRLTSIEKAL